MNNTKLVIFSTVTGNGFKLSEAITPELDDYIGPYNISFVTDKMLEEYDTVIVTYWCNHGTADDDTLNLFKRMKGKNLIVLGTLGAAVESAHGQKVYENVSEAATANNNLLGHFLCRGAIDLKRTAKKLTIPEGEKGHLSSERFEKQKESLGHPNENDFENARKAVREYLGKI